VGIWRWKYFYRRVTAIFFFQTGCTDNKIKQYPQIGSSSFSLPVEVIYMSPTAKFSAEPLTLYKGKSVFFADLSLPGTERVSRWVGILEIVPSKP
jgi:hypothetical protein